MMPKPISLAVSVATLFGAVAFATSAPAAAPDPNKPLTCEGRCARQIENCLKTSRNDRDRADCQFERHACVAKCGR